MIENLQTVLKECHCGIAVTPEWLRKTTMAEFIGMFATNDVRFVYCGEPEVFTAPPPIDWREATRLRTPDGSKPVLMNEAAKVVSEVTG
jgi:hypothetical protein